MDIEDYPRTILEFEQCFASEEACRLVQQAVQVQPVTGDDLRERCPNLMKHNI